MSLTSLTAVELGRKIKAKEVTAVEAMKAVLEQIKKSEGTVNAYVTVDEEGALKRAEEVQKKIDAGELEGPLAGVPVAIKDNMCTEGMLTTCSSKILGLFLSVVVIFHRLRIIFDHLLDHRSQFTFIVYCLQSFFLHIFVRIDIIFKDLFKYFFGNGAVDRSRFCQFNQFRQIFR